MTPPWIAQKYLHLFSGMLAKFHQSREGLWTCRCPYCGDSKKSKTKTRGYFFWKDDVLIYKCHNCGVSTTLQNMIKEYDNALYQDMIIETFGGVKETQKPIIKIDSEKIKQRLSGKLVGIKSVSDGEFLEYLNDRRIPKDKHALFLQIENLAAFAGSFDNYSDRKFPSVKCIGIPFRIGDKVSYVQCRTIEPCGMRYITFEVDGGIKLFGYNEIDSTKTVSVLEGAFDSTFVYNSVANAGAADYSNTDFLIRNGFKLRFVYDRDYEYNAQVKKQLDERIKQGHKVVIYDRQFRYKDMNEAILDGWSIETLNKYLDDRTFSGIKARIELTKIAR